MEETLQKIKEILKEMETTGYGIINIELKNKQVFIDTTYKNKIDLKK